jgi:hypothetical protein
MVRHDFSCSKARLGSSFSLKNFTAAGAESAGETLSYLTGSQAWRFYKYLPADGI